MTSSTGTEQVLRDFIVQHLAWSGRPEDLTSDYDLLVNDVIDSVGIFELVDLIENGIGVEIEDHELVAENFATLAQLARLVESKRGS